MGRSGAGAKLGPRYELLKKDTRSSLSQLSYYVNFRCSDSEVVSDNPR